MAVAARTDVSGAPTDEAKLRELWRKRITQAKEARKPYERIWLSNLAFAAGQQWLVTDTFTGQLRHIQEVDPRQRDRVLYTANRIREYLQAQLGELDTGDDRPELLTAQDGDSAEEIAQELNQAVAHAWDHEWNADAALRKVRRYVLTMGVAAIRSRFDPNKGPVIDHQPVDAQGQPVQDPAHLQALATQGTLPDGSLPTFAPVHEGRTIHEALTAFQILSPPGVPHEDDFLWEVLIRPVHVDEIFDTYGKKVQEDTDIASASGLSTNQSANGVPNQSAGRLRDHAWLYTAYRKPCRQYPEGQVVVLAGKEFDLLDVQQKLPCVTADGERHSGIVYFHWWRLDDRFWSQAFIEPMKDPQRALNEDKTIKREILVRGLPKVFVEKALPERPTGAPMEEIVIGESSSPPVFHQGIGPGPWWDIAIKEAEEDLSHASTLSALRLGENPQNVDTYSQLALLNENEQTKRDTILSDHRAQIATLIEVGVHDIREWWPPQKKIIVSGDEGKIREATFAKSKIPDFFIVDIAGGAAAPRSQAAQIKLIDAIWAAAVAALIVNQDPDAWVHWYTESLKAGEPLELPEVQKDSQQQLAGFENFLMQNGEDVQPADYDLLPVHVPVHREAQDQARAAGDLETYQRIEMHIQASILLVQINAAKQAMAQAQPTPLAGPGQPPQLPPGPPSGPPSGPPAGPPSQP